MLPHTTSPEPGFPKRRTAAVSRIVVPDDTGEGLHHGSSSMPLSSSRGEAPGSLALPPALTALKTPRGLPPRSKQQQQPHADQAFKAVCAACVLMLLVAAACVFHIKHKHLETVTLQLQRQFQADMDLQVEWLAATMAEHQQCKAALEKADEDYLVLKQDLHACRQLQHPTAPPAGKQASPPDGAHASANGGLSASSSTAGGGSSSSSSSSGDSGSTAAVSSSSVPWLQFELASTRQELQGALLKLRQAEADAAALQAKQAGQVAQATEASAKALKEAQAKLQQHEAELKALRGLRQRLSQAEADLEEAQQLLEEHDKQELQVLQAPLHAGSAQQQQQQQAGIMQAALPAAAAAAMTAAPAAGEAAVLVMCEASDADASDDVIRPWCESAVLAGLTHVQVVTGDAGCERAAAEAGLQVLRPDFKVPDLRGRHAATNQRAFAKYAALRRVLAQGQAAVAVEPEVLLLSSPLGLLQHYPTDVAVMSLAQSDADLPYGQLLAPESPAGTAAVSNGMFSMRPVSASLLYLRPTPAGLQLVDVMLDALEQGDRPEQDLLNELLLTLWHVDPATAATIASSSSSGTGTDTAPGALPGLLTVGVLPASLFSSVAAVTAAAEPVGWLQQHKPVGVRVQRGGSSATQRASVMEEVLVHFWAAQPDSAITHIAPEQQPHGGATVGEEAAPASAASGSGAGSGGPQHDGSAQHAAADRGSAPAAPAADEAIRQEQQARHARPAAPLSHQPGHQQQQRQQHGDQVPLQRQEGHGRSDDGDRRPEQWQGDEQQQQHQDPLRQEQQQAVPGDGVGQHAAEQPTQQHPQQRVEAARGEEEEVEQQPQEQEQEQPQEQQQDVLAADRLARHGHHHHRRESDDQQRQPQQQQQQPQEQQQQPQEQQQQPQEQQQQDEEEAQGNEQQEQQQQLMRPLRVVGRRHGRTQPQPSRPEPGHEARHAPGGEGQEEEARRGEEQQQAQQQARRLQQKHAQTRRHRHQPPSG